MTAKVRCELRHLGDHVMVGEIVLANPPLNLVTAAVLADLRIVLNQLEDVDDLRAVVLHQGNARAFCAGSDMREFESAVEAPAERKILMENHLLRQLARLACPTIAAVEGAALGGGLELALACDLRVAGENAQLGLPESGIGGLASNGSQRLTKLVGPSRAKQVLFTGHVLTAAKAEEWGLINDVVADGSALLRSHEIAALIATRAPLSVRLSKQLVDMAVDASVDAGVVAGIEAQEQVFRSADLLEGSRAFRDKRSPRFVGR